MKRIFTLATIFVLLFATVGTTAAIAGKSGNSSNYHEFVVTEGSTSIGKIVVNADPTGPTYVFNGAGLTPGTTYYLYYLTKDGITKLVNSCVANGGGNVHIGAAWTNPVADVTATPAPIFMIATSTFHAAFTYSWTGTVASSDRFPDLSAEGYHFALLTVDARASLPTDAIVTYKIQTDLQSEAISAGTLDSGSTGLVQNIPVPIENPPSTVLVTVTIADAWGLSDSTSLTLDVPSS